MKIDAFNVGFHVQHRKLELDMQDVKSTTTQTSLKNEITTKTKKVQEEKENIKSIDLELSSKLQAELLKSVHASKNSFIRHDLKAEFESLNFKTQATIKADGRELDIDIEANLKRSFLEHNIIDTRKILHDPLVVSLDGTMPELGKTKFVFDIDSNGKSDQISALKNGSGFLALDKNENGVIDDGSELFGTSSGDGFKDLKAYDDDGNGWIDENDEIFDKLQIWEKTDSGDKLVGIGEVGIGAIFLGNAKTEFSIKDVKTNELNGMIKESGMFVFENGRGGIISQIDLASKEIKEQPQLKTIQKLLKNSKALNTYIQKPKEAEIKGESPIDKLKAQINKLKAKLAKAKGDEAAMINAQIISLQAQMLAFMKMGF